MPNANRKPNITLQIHVSIEIPWPQRTLIEKYQMSTIIYPPPKNHIPPFLGFFEPRFKRKRTS